MMSRWLCLAVAAAVAPAPARAERIRLARGAMVFLGAGGTGVCLLSDSGTRDSPCTYVAGAELTLRPTESSPLRLLGGIRSSLYSNDYHGDTSGPEAYYLTQGRELWLGAAWDVLAVSETRSVEIYMAVGRGLGETEEWGGVSQCRPPARGDRQ